MNQSSHEVLPSPSPDIQKLFKDYEQLALKGTLTVGDVLLKAYQFGFLDGKISVLSLHIEKLQARE